MNVSTADIWTVRAAYTAAFDQMAGHYSASFTKGVYWKPGTQGVQKAAVEIAERLITPISIELPGDK